jgi:WXXGXW repeat (2 copies)
MFARLKSLAILVAACATLSTAPVAAQVVVRIGPPPPRVEVVPAARPGYLWTPGYWNWRGNRHVWVNGNWVRERRGYVYRQPAWVEDNGRWRFNRGNWARGDRDRDGVPNRLDRHPDNPRRP